MNRINVPVILACEHTRLIKASSMAAETHCPQCWKNQRIKDVITSEWRAVCRSCSYSRWCGLSAVAANQIANAHARKTSHVIDVTFMDNPASIKVRERLVRLGTLR